MKLLTGSLLLAAAHGNAQSLVDFGTLGGNLTQAKSVSANGSVIVGNASDAGNLSRAFRWSAGVMTDLGTLGGDTSRALAVSADGSVIIGNSQNASAQDRAFRWSAGVMTDLGTLAGNSSDAVAVSADGSVVVGSARNASNQNRAFRWSAGAMTDLGTLGGDYSNANAVSADGSVVVGISLNTQNQGRAFRWSAGVMTDLGTLGGNTSDADAVSADGSVVVGSSRDASNQNRAFRWSNGVMTNLGTLGGNTSSASALSADGSVVVGSARNASNQNRAYRWSAGVMTDLGTLGGNTSSAVAVSADGSTVIGTSTNASSRTRSFLYYQRVMLDTEDWLGSVGGVCSMLSTSLELTRIHLEGAHHRPLAELGRGKTYWVTGDVASSSRSRDLITRSGEAGATFEPWTNVLLGVGAGYGRQDQQLLNGGSASTSGQYLVGELDFLLADSGILSVLVSSGDWQNETDRGYITGAGVDYSHGETDIQSSSFRVRYDTPILAKAIGADIKAYGSYGHIRSRSDAYVETGGSYTGSFSEMEQTAKEGRLGLVASRAFGEKFRGRLSAEWIHRFDRDQAAITATDITSTLDLTLPGAAVQRDQARFGFDFDYFMDAKTTLSFTVHAASRGEVADVSGAVSIRRAF